MNYEFEGLPATRYSPIAGNPFRSRADVEHAVLKLVDPLLPAFSRDGAVVKLDASAAHFDYAAVRLEGFARPLWGLVPYVVGGGRFDHWKLFQTGLANGTDPTHAEYWGDVQPRSQQQVELAALGFSLALIPDILWEPLTQPQKDNVARFLVNGRNKAFVPNNWMFFRILVDLGLARVGIKYDDRSHTDYLDELDKCYVADGWYSDGKEAGRTHQVDYYNAFALHYYGLVYSKIGPDKRRAAVYRQRAGLFAANFQHWFADDGAAVPYGRSLTYRFACGAFWGALAFAGQQPLPWGVIKGLYLRHLRWWSDRPVARLDDNRLSVGYGYPSTFMSEGYNSSNSPYWALKIFLPLALPPSHPFWASEELPLVRQPDHIMGEVGMVAHHGQPNNTVLYVSGPNHPGQRFSPEKYCKFAYSTRYAFNIELDTYQFSIGGFDNMLALSDDGVHYRVRESSIECRILNNVLFSLWKPFSDVTVKTWILPRGNWHVRVHEIETLRELQTLEGGFAVPCADFSADTRVLDSSRSALVDTGTDLSGVTLLDDEHLTSGRRASQTARVSQPLGNSNLLYSRVLVPQLHSTIADKSTTMLVTGVFACPKTSTSLLDEWKKLPVCPSLEQLRQVETADVIELYK